MAAESKSSERGSAEMKDSERGSAKDSLDDEHDDVAFTIIPEGGVGSPSSSRKGMGIDLSLAALAAQERQDAKELSEEDLIIQAATQPCRVLFDLPDGSQVESEFQMGQTVEVLKSFVALECGISMGEQSLFLASGTGPLLDPMSLADYPEIDPSDEVVIRVEGEMEDDGAKK
mmetsp:Transcript_54627/g.109842  ORF Transcript_54627/g.109842 Transcript_54627/m.109842 type:complete len:173 (-) Transcript_54627:263-781(-)|eukprot:CAMPEP_0171599482 /NCGR_PEP_ID=MMETSP0990-20121206/3748_1 /TAXON_ID=483369 /ORGANISM="non described non described, Strain CCMP2098" /LENGTH=172 /DNA_ID=CAMNT_0012161245 /DNA_START=3 /DNA_END=524 /DNA_ORIENTATION=-